MQFESVILASHAPIILCAGGVSLEKFVSYRAPFFDGLKPCPIRVLIDEIKRGDGGVSVGKEHVDPEHVSDQCSSG
jgi:hypothetical protein